MPLFFSYNMMMLCWAKDPDKRPEFSSLHIDLLTLIGQSPAAIPPVVAKRRQSEGITPVASPTSPGSAQFKLPEVIGPMGKRAQQQQLEAERGLVDQSTNAASSYRNLAVVGEEAAKTAQEIARYSGTIVSSDGPQQSRRLSGVVTAATSATGSNGGDRRSSVTLVVTSPPKATIKNVRITIPTCFQHRDLSRSVAAEYVQLVDNYEPAPKFNNSFKLKSRRSSKSQKENSAERGSVFKRNKNKKPPVAPRTSSVGKSSLADCRAAAGYSSLVLDIPDAAARVSAGSRRGPSLAYAVGKEGNYFELENGMRTSAGSDRTSARQSGRSSALAGSIASLVDARSGHASSSPSISRASAASSLGSTPGVQRSSRSQLVGGSGSGLNNATKQLPVVEQLRAGLTRPQGQPTPDESSVVDDEVSSYFDTDL